jgi:hypothetical protein
VPNRCDWHGSLWLTVKEALQAFGALWKIAIMSSDLVHLVLSIVFAGICLFSGRILFRHTHDYGRKNRSNNALGTRH